jgi:hypothetical protein
VRQYLSSRGIPDSAIQRYGLGFNPANAYALRGKWGLPDGDKLWLPKGILIPYVGRDGRLIALNIRRPVNSGHKYHKVAGSRRGLFGWRNLARGLHLFTEGEFDCILADLEIGDVAGVATWGSTSMIEALFSPGAGLTAGPDECL